MRSQNATFSAGWDSALGAFEISSVALIRLVFVPPGFDRNGVCDVAAISDAAAGS